LIPCVKYILTAMHVCFKHYGTHHSWTYIIQLQHTVTNQQINMHYRK
jgi:hypothetical protein